MTAADGKQNSSLINAVIETVLAQKEFVEARIGNNKILHDYQVFVGRVLFHAGAYESMGSLRLYVQNESAYVRSFSFASDDLARGVKLAENHLLDVIDSMQTRFGDNQAKPWKAMESFGGRK